MIHVEQITTAEQLHAALIALVREQLAEGGDENPTPESVEDRARWLCCLMEAAPIHDDGRLCEIAYLFQDGVPKMGTSLEWCQGYWQEVSDDPETRAEEVSSLMGAFKSF